MRFIKIDEQIQREAEEAAGKILSRRKIKRKPNYTGLSHPDRFLTGYLGEFCFKKILEQEKIRHLYRICTSGKSQRSEFILFSQGCSVTTDVKTASKPHHTNLMMPVTQFAAHDTTGIFVAARIVNGFCEFHGFADRIMMMQVREKSFGYVPTLAVPFYRLRTMDDLFRFADHEP